MLVQLRGGYKTCADQGKDNIEEPLRETTRLWSSAAQEEEVLYLCKLLQIVVS